MRTHPRYRFVRWIALLALLIINSQISTVHAQGTAFTYEGQLQSGGNPANGTFNLTFSLYNVASGGAAIAGPLVVNGVAVANGLFTVTLDFGSGVWNGQIDWLEIGVEGSSDSGFTTLAPRQQITPAPYAIFATTASNLSGTLPVAQLNGTVGNSQLANSSIAVNTGTGLSGGGPVALGGAITLNNTGVTSLTGGDGVTVSGATGDLTLGLGSTLTLGGLPVVINTGGSTFLYADNRANYFAGLDAGNPAPIFGFNTGFYNTATGANALFDNFSGSYNTANGADTLQENEAGSYNVGYGAGALQYSGGSYNTALGSFALVQLGGNNIGRGGGSNNIAIGFDAGSAYGANESSNIDIGNIGVAGESGVIRIGTPGIQTTAYIAGVITGNGSGLTDLNASQLTSGTINNSQLANSSITINTGTGLSAAGSPVALGGTITLNNTGVTSLTDGDGVTVSATTGDLTLGLGTTLTLTGTMPAVINTQSGSLLYADSDGNYYAGLHVGNSTSSGADNTAAGNDAFHSNLDGVDSTAFGADALSQNRSGSFNTALGPYALSVLGQSSLAGGSNNIAIGYEAGNAYTGNESSNIDIGNAGITGDGNVIRIGNQQAVAYIAGVITGNGSGLTGLNPSQLTSGTINNSQLANSSITVTAGAGLNGGGTVALGGSTTLNNAGVTSLTGGGGVTVSATTGGVTLGSTATSLNTDNTIVSRDSTGSFAAQNLTLAGVLNLPAPPVTINSGASSLLLGDGNRDLFVGLAAGNLTSGAGDNTALGYESLHTVTSGNQNVAVGSQSLAADTTGVDNVAVGYLALQQNTAGFGNTACGWESLMVNTNGWYDTAIGLWALVNNISGHNNTAVGYFALGLNTTGTENTAFGVHANVSNTTGSNNVAVGYWSLNNVEAGVSNIAVGYEAGINLVNSDSGNIDIGNAGVGGEDDIIRIGTPGIQTNTYLAGVCDTRGYGCQQGINGTSYGNTFNFWWTGTQLQAWVDVTDVGVVSLTSDRRLKENIEPMTDDALTRVMALKPSSFKYKTIPGTIFQGDGQTQEGFIADELQQVIPSAVNGEKDGLTSKGTIQPQTVNLMPVVAVLTKAVQDQQKEIDELKAMLKTLSERK